MNHPIKLNSIFTVIALGMFVAGCGESRKEKEAKERERQRIEAEQQAARDLQKSNEAVTAVGQKLGRKVEPLDIGTTQAKKTETTAPPAPKP